MDSKEKLKFKDMGEVKATVEALKGQVTEEDYELLQYFFGLLDNRAISEVVMLKGEEVKIDKFLVPIIMDLNNRGYQTLASCSGLQEEHPQERFKPESGYLSIAFDKELLDYLQSNLNDPIIEVREGEAYLNPSVSIRVNSKDDDVLKEKWLLIWDVLKSR